MKFHFWWSDNYLARVTTAFMKPEPVRTAILDNGEVVNYMLASNSKDEKPSLDTDLEYLGHGEIYSINGVRQ